MFLKTRTLISRFMFLAGISLAALLAHPASARADTFTVTTTNDGVDGSLRAAIAASNNGGTDNIIQFQPGLSGQITLTEGALSITNDVSIEGPGANILAIDAGKASQVINVPPSTGSTVDLYISGLTLRNGFSLNSEGGCIRCGGALTLEDCAISDNTDELNGGGIYMNGDGGTTITLTARRCLFANNTASGSGGAVCFNRTWTSILENCTFTTNNAPMGAAVYTSFAENLSMESCTVTANTAGSFGGGVVSSMMEVDVHNCIIAGNTAPTGQDVYGPFFSNGYNLIGNSVNSDGWTNSDLIGIDPRLGLLADNGGPTETCALLPGSPAINGGDPTNYPATDQRGIARPQGSRADIGAFEFYIPAPVLTVPATVSGNSGIPLSFRATALDPSGDTLTFSLVSAPAGASIDGDTGMVQWTPGAPGTYTIQVLVTDPNGTSDTKSATVIVADIPPVLTVPASVSGVLGNSVSFQATAADAANLQLSFSLVGAPAGAEIDSSTGVVTWTPTSGGTFTIQTQVSDPYGAIDTKTTTVNVSALALQNVTITRDIDGTVTLQFLISNAAGVEADDVTVTAGVLGGVNTSTPLPKYSFKIKPGASKQATLQFQGVPSGTMNLNIQGACSLGAFFLSQTVTAP